MISTDRKADIVYKAKKGVASTTTLRAFYEETHSSLGRVIPTQIWNQASDIPGTAPGGIHNQIIGVVQRKISVVLTQEPGKPNAWYSNDLKDCIDPERFGTTYAPVFYDNSAVVIPAGSGNYDLDYDAGVLTFDNTFVVGNAPVKASFYKYVGTKGLATSGGAVAWVTSVLDLKDVTTMIDGNYLSVVETNRLYVYDAASTAVIDDVLVIKPNSVSGAGRWLSQKIIASDSAQLEVGAAPQGKVWTDGFVPVPAGMAGNSFYYELSRIIKLLAPTKPAALGELVFDFPLYAALEAGTGTEHACTNENEYVATITEMYDPQASNLVCSVDGIVEGTIALTPGSDVDSDGPMSITADYDPYVGEEGRAGFYHALDVSITTPNMSNGPHSFRLEHLTEGFLQVDFYADSPVTVTVTAITVTPNGGALWVSGVPSLDVDDVIAITATLVNAVKTHYAIDTIAVVSAPVFTTVNVDPPVVPPIANANVPISVNAPVLINKYVETLTVGITGYNSKGVAGTPASLNGNIRVDTVSFEQGSENPLIAARLTAGTGQYPGSGLGNMYDSTLSLRTVLTHELQKLNGRYMRPKGNYVSNLPVAGPDYSTGMGTSYRYFVDTTIGLVSCSGFTITFTNSLGLVQEDLNDDNAIRVQVHPFGGNWLDANKTFALVGAPTAQGDACMVFADSSATVRRVSFGNVPRSGLCFVRVGLPSGSLKEIGPIVISDIV